MRLFRYSLFVVLLVGPTSLPAQPVFTEVNDGSPVASVRSWGASWVDYDGDGDLDLFASRFATTGGNLLVRNDGGTFVVTDAGPLTTGPGSIGHSWGDFDNDGDPDALTIGGTGGFGNTGAPIRLLRNEGPDGEGWSFSSYDSSPFSPTDGRLGWSGAWGDFDNDGILDFVIAHANGFVGESQTNHLFRGIEDTNGFYFFESVEDGPIVTGTDAYTIPSWSDYDQDGDLDLFIGSGPANGSVSPDNLYRNTLSEGGSATFNRITTDPIATNGHDGQVMNWIDFDNDGDLDLYVTNYRGTTNKLYRNDHPAEGAGPFVEVTDSPLADPVDGYSLANTWGDFDNDGDLDVLVAVARSSTSTTGYNHLYLNDGDGTFSQDFDNKALVEMQESTSGATVGDFDNDGDLDLATSSPSPSTPNLRVYRNDTDNGNGWIKIQLAGTSSNRSAIGARVRATATIGGQTVVQRREVSAQNTFAGQNALTVHFGLGDATEARVRIDWPSGIVDVLDVSAGTQMQVSEGQFVDAEQGAVPGTQPALDAPYPNPTADGMTVRYSVPSGNARLVVYDLLGRQLQTLAIGVHTAGPHTATWNGTDAAGRSLSAGLYVLRLESAGQSVSRRLSIVR